MFARIGPSELPAVQLHSAKGWNMGRIVNVLKLESGNSRRRANIDRGRALVAGGAGFLGSHLCERLLLDGYDVVVLDNSRQATASLM
jgi:hypothetical protein